MAKGQVIGGRWKPLQHMYKQSIYADVMATCGVGGACYVSNDGIDPFDGTLTLTAVDFASGTQSLAEPPRQLDMAAGACSAARTPCPRVPAPPC